MYASRLECESLLVFNFNDAPSILVDHFKFWCVSGQIFSEILRILEKDCQLSRQFSNFQRFLVSSSLKKAGCKWFSEILRTPKRMATEFSVLGEGLATESMILQEYSSTKLPRQFQLPILPRDFRNLWEASAWNASKLKMVV
jgi:hypothetical protein